MQVTVFGGLGTEILGALPGSPLREGIAVAETWSTGPGGSACRQAHAAARFGCSTKLIGVVGMDAFGAYVLRRMGSLGVDVSGVRAVPVALTSITARFEVPSPGEGSVRCERAASMSADWVDPWILRGSGVLLLQQDLPAADAAQLALLARQGGCLVVLNASGFNSRRTCDPIPADWVTTDARSLQNLCCAWDIFGIDPADKIRLLAARLKCGVACYLGREGALASLKNGEKVAVSGRRRVSVSERAASAFSAVFGVMMRETADPATALRYAASAAEVAELGRHHPDFADRETVERAMFPLATCGE
jgi:ribokinase